MRSKKDCSKTLQVNFVTCWKSLQVNFVTCEKSEQLTMISWFYSGVVSAAYVDLHRPTSAYTGLHRPIPAYIVLYRPTSSYTGLHRPIPAYIVLYRPTSTYIDPNTINRQRALLYYDHFVLSFHCVKMPYNFRRTCPICYRQDLLYLANHLRQVHKLSSEERQPLLKAALFSHQLPPSFSPRVHPQGLYTHPI